MNKTLTLAVVAVLALLAAPSAAAAPSAPSSDDTCSLSQGAIPYAGCVAKAWIDFVCAIATGRVCPTP